ncbi:hypothetical protein PALB_320 [Pseudoalteromonas luteoviolacea B = ATCC 29581]|nr:hypothetical protein PALB_320 [Pseudoalteromonas luteoviolacea B = ATCC 29581]
MDLKNKLSLILYWFAIAFSALNFLAIVIIGWEFIYTGKGIGSFALLWFVGYGAVSTLAWLIGFFVSRRAKLDLIYWLTIVMPLVMFFVLPVKFVIE